MGIDAAVNARAQEPGAKGRDDGQPAEVVELLPAAAYRLRLENEASVIAHAAGAGEKNFMRLRPGDRVRVVLSARDKTRGRIVELCEKG